LQFPVGLNAV